MSDKIDTWALLELFGHQKIVGKVTEHELGGTAMLRVDVPGVEGQEPFTKFYGPSAIFSLTPISEAVGLALAKRLRADPISVYAPELRALSPGRDSVEDADVDPLDDDGDPDDGLPLDPPY